MNNLKHSLKVTGIAALVMLVLVIALVVGITASQSATPDTTVPTSIPTIVPTPTVDIATLPAYQLASIDGADITDPATIARYQKVLDSLHDKTGESETNIANETYAAQGILTKDNYVGDDSMLTLMNGVDGAITKSEHQKYIPTLDLLITLMENPS